jgi:hypothetical protein
MIPVSRVLSSEVPASDQDSGGLWVTDVWSIMYDSEPVWLVRESSSCDHFFSSKVPEIPAGFLGDAVGSAVVAWASLGFEILLRFY